MTIGVCFHSSIFQHSTELIRTMVYSSQEFDFATLQSGELTQLSPSTVYYLRKLMRQNLDRIENKPESDMTFDDVTDINAALEQLYPVELLRSAKRHKLERLALFHRTLTTQGSQHSQQLFNTESAIFNILGCVPREQSTIGTILIIDDTPLDVNFLQRTFSQQPYRILHHSNGNDALAAAQSEMPDLIFLDVLIAGMDGYDLCRQLKSAPETKDIAIIFTSALNDVQSKVKAFGAGGADFMTKPFQAEEVLARAQHQLQIRDLQTRLETQNVKFQAQIHENQSLAARYQSIIESSIDGIFQSTLDGQFISVNPSLARIYGYESPEELIQHMDNIGQQLYVHPTRRDGLNAYLKQHGQIVGAESRVYRKDGSKIWISENVRAVKDHKDRILYYEGTIRDVTDRRRMESDLRHQRQETERMLASILPPNVADRLRDRREMIADRVADATVMMADIQGFTALSRQMPPLELVGLMSRLFSTFDQLVEDAGLEKIKTVRDVYILAGGVHTPKPDHAVACATVALLMQSAAATIQRELNQPFQLRIGMSTGSLIASVIGMKKITYDIWGDCVNLASRMQSSASPGMIQVSPSTQARISSEFILESRGETDVLGVGTMETFCLLDHRSMRP
jgi:adenylate cyclase